MTLSTFNILPLSCVFNVLILIWLREILFWSYMFGVLNASCIWIGISFPNSGEFSVMILLKMSSLPLEQYYSPSYDS